MNLYGQDMDENITRGRPDSPGPSPSRAATSSAARRSRSRRPRACEAFVGLVIDDNGVLPASGIVPGAGDGEILSGGFSPTLGKSIAFARVPAGTGPTVQADIRGKLVPVRVVKYPFVRDGKSWSV